MIQKRICIIGAGPAGLAALKVILDSSHYKTGKWSVVCFESREGVGGIWNPAEPLDDPPLTPLYDSLTTNIPHPVMAYTSYPFPPSTPIFPPASTVQTYLEAYTSQFVLASHIHFNRTVDDVSWLKSQSLWKVRLLCGSTNYFEAVIVANGHFRKPRYPDVDGVLHWLQSGCAIHSAWYRRQSDLRDQVRRVLVVGNGPSGQDIVTDLLLQQHFTVFHSIRGTYREDGCFLNRRGGVLQLKDNKDVLFEDGTVETNIDLCIFATGYEMSFPFLSTTVLNTVRTSASHSLFLNKGTLWNSTYHVYPLAKHIFPMGCEFPPSSLAFMGLILRGTPLSLYEAQAYAIVKVFTQPDSLNTEKEKCVIQARRQQLGPNGLVISQLWHKFTEPESFEYRDGLYKFAELDVHVEDWEKDIWLYKVELRREWQALVQQKQAGEWINGVGGGGKQEWISLLKRILANAGVTV